MYPKVDCSGRILSVLVLLASLLCGCLSSPEFDGAKPALDYLAKVASPPGAFSFDAGEYQGGTAVIGQNDEAFWTKDGKAYYVNDAAKAIAPDLEKAPDEIQFDDAFRSAAKSEN